MRERPTPVTLDGRITPVTGNSEDEGNWPQAKRGGFFLTKARGGKQKGNPKKQTGTHHIKIRKKKRTVKKNQESEVGGEKNWEKNEVFFILKASNQGVWGKKKKKIFFLPSTTEPAGIESWKEENQENDR